ncbi:MAG TPA: ABC transporter substrate-binding protein [Xanthobacteraceae bacterium]|jgi:ABC-type nitrate/sulfonate/bicarbonate transport system substrate-binding protein|nr:ABC transporter substrate-binding protein [Xanthobacteraceae bacterium]
MSRLSVLPCAAIVLLTAAAALVAGAPASLAQNARNPTSIKATELEPPPDPSLAFNRMADAMGLFEKHGLKLDLGPALGGGGPARVQAVVTNNTDVATSDIISVLGGIYSGAKIKILMVMTPYGDEEAWATNKYQTLKDAVGQPWGVASLGGAQRFNAQMTAEGMGFKSDSFQWVAVSGADAARLEALDTGRTQLTSLSHLGAVTAEAKGFTKQVHVVVLHSSQQTPPIPRLVVVAQASWLKDHQDVATRYVEMMLDANRQWQNNASSWVDAAAKIYKDSGLDDQQFHKAWELFQSGGYFSVNGGINFAATQKIMDLFFKLRSESPNDTLSKPSDVYDTGPLKAALDKMGVVKGAPGLPDVPDWYGAKAEAAK